MNRRHFVQISGTTLAGLLFLKQSLAGDPPVHLVRLPSTVMVKLDDGLHLLAPSGADQWDYKDVRVFTRYAGEALKIIVQSPREPLHKIILKWDYPQDTNTRILGDHWERSYGDLFFQPNLFGRKLPWYFIQHNGKSTVCFGVKTGSNSICYWQMGNGSMQLSLDTRSAGIGVSLGERTLNCAEVVATRSTPAENAFGAARRFCGMLCEKPRLPELPVYGINDWYFAYGNNSYRLILEHTARLANLVTDTHNRSFSVIDSGWAKYAPKLPGDCCWQEDFSRPNDKFGDMQKLAFEIRKLGMRPGLWTRPLAARHDDPLTLLLPSIPGRDNPDNPILDPSIPENLERIRRNISIYKAWGFELVKHDYSAYDILGKWGFQMTDDITTSGWRFSDNTRTTAEIVLQLYQAIREAAGELYLIGCNTFSHLAAGIFELNRIGDDTSGKEWARTKKMGVNAMGFRMIQHNRFYAADGDCVGLTREVPWAKNKQWMELLAGSSAPLFISAEPDALGAEQKSFIKTCFARAAKKESIAEPLDWLTSQWPSKWRLDGQLRDFDWG